MCIRDSSNSDWTRAIHFVYGENEVDPFREWLEQLPEWDGVPRLDNWLQQSGFVFSADAHPELMAWAQRYILLGSITRTYRPGYKLDVSPVLSSTKGGLGKSMVLRELFEPSEAHDMPNTPNTCLLYTSPSPRD